MISEFDDELKNEYYRSQEELINRGIAPDGLESLLLSICRKEDSLINCLGQIKVDNMLMIFDKYSEEYKNESKEKAIEVIKMAYEISIKDQEKFINDEHILYALINIKCDYLEHIYHCINLNVKDVKLSVDDYFEFEDDDYLVDLTYLGKLDKFNPFIGRKEYIDKIIRIISKKQKNNCILIGNAGVGKSALVEGVVMTLIKQKKVCPIYRLELGVIIAGTRYRGDLEERLCNVIKKVKKEHAILFIDEIHNIVGGTKGEEALNIANILKPILARSEIKCIGATTLEEYYDYIEKDKALTRRFQTLFIPEATEEETLKILKKIKSKYEEFYQIKYSNDILKAIIKACAYFPNRKYPDKAIDILDEIGAYTISRGGLKPQIKDIKRIVFENLGIKINYLNKTLSDKINHSEIVPFFQRFIKQIENNTNNKTIMNAYYLGSDDTALLNDIRMMYGIREEAIIKIDFDLFDENAYKYLVNSILKYPIACVVCYSFEHSRFSYYNTKIRKIMEHGVVYDDNRRLISFKNTIFIMTDTDNKEVIGFNNNTQVEKNIYDLVIYEKNINSGKKVAFKSKSIVNNTEIKSLLNKK